MKTAQAILFAICLFVVIVTVVPEKAIAIWGYICLGSSCFICSALLWRFR